MSESKQNCRGCFGENDVNISIFSHVKIQGKRLKVKDLLLQYTQIQVLHKDLPTKICIQCLEHLQKAHIFSEKCLETEKLLQHTITPTEDPTSPIQKLLSGRRSKKKYIVSDNYLSTKSPREIKILPKQNVSNAIMLNATSSDLPIANPLIVLQNAQSKPIKNFGYEVGLMRKSIYTCSLCSRKFVSSKYLCAHMNSVHGDVQLTSKCHACNVELESKADLIKHNEVMHFTTRHIDNRTKQTCKICSKRFRNHTYLAKHMSKMHMGVTDESGAESIDTKKVMDETVKQSSDEDVNISCSPIECKVCGKTFGFYKNYRIHKSIHEPNVCLRCNKCFPNKDLLLAHLNSHTKDNPFTCAYCNKVYLARTALLAHYKSSYNIREKVYFCGLCDAISEAYLCHENVLQHLELHEEQEQPVDADEVPENCEQQDDPTEVLDAVDTENNVAALDSDTVHYIVINDGDCDGEKYVEISAEQVDMLISGELTESDLIQATKLLESIEPNSDADRMDTIHQETDSPLRPQEVTDAVSEGTPDANGSETLVFEADDVETHMSDTNYDETILFETNVAKKNVAVIEVSDTNVAETNVADMVETDSPETNVAVTDMVETDPAKMHMSQYLWNSGKYKCLVCGDILTRRFNLMRHQAIAHQMFTMRCAYCPQKFNNTRLYDVHRFNCALVHGYGKPPLKKSKKKNGYGEVNCPICLEKFPSKTPMLRHLAVKHPEDAHAEMAAYKKEYQCHICDTKVTTRTGFSYHMKSRHGFPRFACVECGRRFTSTGGLRSHVACKHSANKPHSCTLCGKGFVNKDHLRKHIKLTHRGQRDFLCGVCGLTFLQSSHVQQHMWKHTGVKPHKCAYCPSRYTTKASLKKHLNRMHADEYIQDQAKKEAQYKEMEMAEQERLNRTLLSDELKYEVVA